LTTYIPTEVLTLYVSALAALGPVTIKIGNEIHQIGRWAWNAYGAASSTGRSTSRHTRTWPRRGKASPSTSSSTTTNGCTSARLPRPAPGVRASPVPTQSAPSCRRQRSHFVRRQPALGVGLRIGLPRPYGRGLIRVSPESHRSGPGVETAQSIDKRTFADD
jgi:hypothetical protein